LDFSERSEGNNRTCTLKPEQHNIHIMHTPLEQARLAFLQGVEHFESGRVAQARISFEDSLALAPGRPSVLGNLGVCLYALREWIQAVEVLQQATAADADNADAWICLGLSQEHLGQWLLATQSLARGLALRPANAVHWLMLGQCRMRVGDVNGALAAFDQALKYDVTLGAAWSARGSLMREIGDLQQAAMCFEKALANGAEPTLHHYYLASVLGKDGPSAPPRMYVESLFDDYAADFQSHLVEQLGYQAHETLVRPLLARGGDYEAVLDLGCGTGLCGALIGPVANAIDGVDVSSAMLDQARAGGAYRDLAHADLAAYLAASCTRYDLVLAADVFIYVGALETVFAEVCRILMPAGCFAFSVEPSDHQEVQLMPSLRYAHSQDYIRRLAQRHGLIVDKIVQAPIRHDQQQPVMGLYCYLHSAGGSGVS
jgi:predicted TPR repeat methyltransferase